MALKYIEEAEVKGKRVLTRFDFNVPLDSQGEITDTTRIDRALPTLKELLSMGAKKIVIISHLGRPKGTANKKLSLLPVAKKLAEALDEEVVLTESAKDRGIKSLLSLPEAKIILLENIRFHAEEEANDREFAQLLSSYGELFVFDAFGTAHRKHASTYEIMRFFPKTSYAGPLMKSEIEAFNSLIENQKRPFVALVGGAKISDKIKVVDRLFSQVDHLIIGGAMAYPFLKAKGVEIGKSLCHEEDLELAKRVLSRSGAEAKLVLPIDHIISEKFNDGEIIQTPGNSISEEFMGLDIGPKSIELFSSYISKAKTIFWNGPMGIFENENFSKGTFAMAKAMADSSAKTVVGGGDSVSAVIKSGHASKIHHVSTGGGAGLEYIDQGGLPGVQALKFGI